MADSTPRALARLVAALRDPSSRVTFVLGAGVSAAAGAYVPASAELQEHILGEYASVLRLDERYPGGPPTLDLVISAFLQEFDDDTFNNKIAPFFPTRERPLTRRPGETYDLPAAPTFAHEVIAHWLHHRAVSWVIDFNFDELLFTAMDDEAGLGSYQACGTVPDFFRAADELDRRGIDGLRPYRIFKPHGTMSVPTSLVRHRDEVVKFPPPTKNVLLSVLNESSIVVMAGFALNEPDLQTLLREVRRPRFLVVKRRPGEVVRQLQELGIEASKIDYASQAPNEFVTSLVGMLKDAQKEEGPPYHLWDVARHELRDLLFNTLRVPATLSNRLRLAYVMHAVKQHGTFCAAAFDHCPRLSNYVRLAPETVPVFTELCSRQVFRHDHASWYYLEDLPRAGDEMRNERFLAQLTSALHDAEGLRQADARSRVRLVDLFSRIQHDCDIQPRLDDGLREVELPGAEPLTSLLEVVQTATKVIELAEGEVQLISEPGWWLARPSRFVRVLRDRGVKISLLLVLEAEPLRWPPRDVQRTHFLGLQGELGEQLKVAAVAEDPGWRLIVNGNEVADGLGVALRRRDRQIRSSFWRARAGADLRTLRDRFDQAWKRADPVASFDDLERLRSPRS